MLFAFIVFAMGGNDWQIQIGFALSIAKLGCLIIGARTALSPKKSYLVSTLIGSSTLPCFYFGQMIYERSQPFSYYWGFADYFFATLVFIDLIEIFLTLSRLVQLHKYEVTPWPQ